MKLVYFGSVWWGEGNDGWTNTCLRLPPPLAQALLRCLDLLISRPPGYLSPLLQWQVPPERIPADALYPKQKESTLPLPPPARLDEDGALAGCFAHVHQLEGNSLNIRSPCYLSLCTMECNQVSSNTFVGVWTSVFDDCQYCASRPCCPLPAQTHEKGGKPPWQFSSVWFEFILLTRLYLNKCCPLSYQHL